MSFCWSCIFSNLEPGLRLRPIYRKVTVAKPKKVSEETKKWRAIPQYKLPAVRSERAFEKLSRSYLLPLTRVVIPSRRGPPSRAAPDAGVKRTSSHRSCTTGFWRMENPMDPLNPKFSFPRREWGCEVCSATRRFRAWLGEMHG